MHSVPFSFSKSFTNREHCGHIFCKECYEQIKDHAETNNVELCCPLDRHIIDVTRVFNDKSDERKVLSLKVKCPNFAVGCTWTGELREALDHERKCFKNQIAVNNSFEMELKKIIKRMTELETKVQCQERKLDDRQKNLDCQTQVIENQSKQMDTLTQAIENQKKKMNILTQAIDNQNKQMNTQAAHAIDNQNKQMNTQTQAIDNQNKQMNSLTQAIENQKKKMDNQNIKIKTLQEQVDDKNKQIEVLTKQVENQCKQFEDLDKRLEDQNKITMDLKIQMEKENTELKSNITEMLIPKNQTKEQDNVIQKFESFLFKMMNLKLNFENSSNFMPVCTALHWQFSLDKVRSGNVYCCTPLYNMKNSMCFAVGAAYVENKLHIGLLRVRGKYDHAMNEIAMTTPFSFTVNIFGNNGNCKLLQFTNSEHDYQIPIDSDRSRSAWKVISNEEVSNFTIDGDIHLHCFFNDVS